MSKKNNKKTNVSISKGVAINSFFLVKDFLSDEEVDALKEVDNAIDEMNIAFDAVVYSVRNWRNGFWGFPKVPLSCWHVLPPVLPLILF